MKKAAGIFIFLILLILSISLVYPAYKKITQNITGLIENFRNELEEKTDITFSYKSLSPSILAGIKIKGIVIKDAQYGNNNAQINKIFLHFNIKKLFTKNISEIIQNVTINGITLSVDSSKENRVFEKLSSLIRSKNDTPKAEKFLEEDYLKIKKTLEYTLSKIPFNIFITNININYCSKTLKSSLSLKKISAITSTSASAVLIKFLGNAKYFRIKEKEQMHFKFSNEINLNKDLENSSLLLRISNLNYKNYILNRINLFCTYESNKFKFKTVQNTYPLFVEGFFDIFQQDISISLQTKNLKASSFIYSSKKNDNFNKIKNMLLSLNVKAAYNITSKNVSYNSSGKIFIPEDIFKGGIEAFHSLSGNLKNITVNKLKLSGENIDIDFAGKYIFSGIRLSGSANVNKIIIPNGGIISTELYFDPLNSGFIAYAPQLMLGEKIFTALQFSIIPHRDSLDFSFELSDYAHAEEQAGLVKINGSYINGTKYIQSVVSASGMYLDSIAETGIFFSSKKKFAQFQKYLSPYVFSGELFVSSDLKTAAFNVPYAFIANTQKDNQFILLSLDGNDSSLHINRLDYIIKDKAVQFSAQFEKLPDQNEAFFFADMNINSNIDLIPYHFAGSILPGALSLSGDYGFSFDVRSDELDGYEGIFKTENFPIPALETIFTFSSDMNFILSKENGISIKISHMESVEAGNKFSFNPRAAASGTINNYGAFFENITYSDKFSSLGGKSQLLWNINNKIFDSSSFSLLLKNPFSSESLEIIADITNPEAKNLSIAEVKKSFYLNSQLILRDIGLSRFTDEQSENNSLSATLIAAGIVENIYTAVNIDNLSFITGGKTLYASGLAYIEDKELTVDAFKLKYNNIFTDNIKAVFNISSFEGKANAVISTSVMEKTVNIPIEFSISETVKEKNKIFPSEFVANLKSENVSGSLFKESFPLSLTLLHYGNTTVIFTSDEIGLTGTVSNSGKINFNMKHGKPVQFNLEGDIGGKNIDVKLAGVSIDAGKLFSYLDIEELKIYKGALRGFLGISGLKNDPEFVGAFSFTNAEFYLPSITPYIITLNKTILAFDHNMLIMPETESFIKNNNYPIYTSLRVYFERWFLERVEANIRNKENSYIPLHINLPIAEAECEAYIYLNILFSDSIFDVSGDIKIKNSDITSKVSAITTSAALTSSDKKPALYLRSNIDITLGEHVNFVLDPLFRTVFVPNSKFKFKYDMQEAAFTMDGNIAMRSGDISYLNRNFYLKNGSIKFNSNDPTFNPCITIQAETRERDENGNEVRIMLSANNQYLSNFKPVFTSIPSKPDLEIQAMLGQIALGDSDNVSSFLFSAGDYAIQSIIGRHVENKVRDIFNFDIFSVRTMFLQNTFRQSLAQNSSDSSLEISNILDNSTVYIGKYFGSTLYADTLMHWSYDKNRINDSMTFNGLVFRPELGLELNSPFVNIRLNMAADMDAILNNRLAPSTSVTLSWKFDF